MVKKRLQIYFSGYVQGVGFRFTAQRIARNIDLFGWVKNLPDGRVEAICEGSEANIMLFLDRITNHSEMSSNIHNVETNWQSPANDLSSFEIRF